MIKTVHVYIPQQFAVHGCASNRKEQERWHCARPETFRVSRDIQYGRHNPKYRSSLRTGSRVSQYQFQLLLHRGDLRLLDVEFLDRGLGEPLQPKYHQVNYVAFAEMSNTCSCDWMRGYVHLCVSFSHFRYCLQGLWYAREATQYKLKAGDLQSVNVIKSIRPT